MKSFAAEVIADSSGKFCGNSLRFATRIEAERYARNLANRWFLIHTTRVVESDDPVNYMADEHGNIESVWRNGDERLSR